MSFMIAVLAFVGALALVLGVIFAGVWVFCSITDNTEHYRMLDRRMDLADTAAHEMLKRLLALERVTTAGKDAEAGK